MSDDLPYRYPYPHPAVTTDIVVFTQRESLLHVLLIERANKPYLGMWALPGGFLEIDEDLDVCARRELKEETGLDNIPLAQLRAFGRPDRDPRERVISVVYYAFVNSDLQSPKAASDAADTRWFPLTALPPMAFDHAEIIQFAHKHPCKNGHEPRAGRCIESNSPYQEPET